MKRSDLDTATLCRAIAKRGMQAWEHLCQHYPRKVVLAAIDRDTRRGYMTWGVAQQRPFLTDKGRRFADYTYTVQEVAEWLAVPTALLQPSTPRLNLLRWLWAELTGIAQTIGYTLRPYDMLADRRRWFWQPRYPCSRSPQAQHLAAHIRKAMQHKGNEQ